MKLQIPPPALDEEADRVVCEMIELGAKFDVTRSGTGDLQWFYEARPSMREPLRRYRAGIDFTRSGMQEAMGRAVMRAKFSGAP